jgi:hypothetical protein
MITLAIAALAMLAPAKQQGNYILPLYDLCTSVDASGNVTANFMLNRSWNSSINNSSNFRFYFQSGNTSAFSPNGNWNPVNPNSFTPISGNQVTITFNNNQFNSPSPDGTLWIMYNGNANECSNGAEASVIATSVGLLNQQGHNGRPGSIAPIKDVTPADDLVRQSHNLNISFNVNMPFSGWGNSTPNFWMNTGNNNSPYPGNGWQNMNTTNLGATNGLTVVSTTGHPNSNAGYYCVGCMQTYAPNESYNPSNWYWNEFSAVIRQFTTQ